MVYVNIEDKNALTSIDAKKAVVVTSWPLTGCEEPSGLAMDLKTADCSPVAATRSWQ